MITIIRSGERGSTHRDWLDSRHTFSFGDYRDPTRMGFGSLRVINEDRVIPGGGFPTHGHRDMEIVSYVLAGELEHRDSLGNGSSIHPGDVQRMSAGTGVTHSEYNPSRTDPVHFLQIWILPREAGLPPGYEQKAFPVAERRGRLRLVVSPDGREGSVTVHQDTFIYVAVLDPGGMVAYDLTPGRKAYVQVARGEVQVNGHGLRAGDGMALDGEARVRLESHSESELLLFDL